MKAPKEDLRVLLAESVAALASAERERDALRHKLEMLSQEHLCELEAFRQEQAKSSSLASSERAGAASLAAELAKTQQRARLGEASKYQALRLEATVRDRDRQISALEQQVEQERRARANEQLKWEDEKALLTAECEQLRLRSAAAAQEAEAVAIGVRERAESALAAAAAAAMVERHQLQGEADAKQSLAEEREAHSRAAAALVEAQAELAEAQADRVKLKTQIAQAEYDFAERAGALHSRVLVGRRASVAAANRTQGRPSAAAGWSLPLRTALAFVVNGQKTAAESGGGASG